MAIKTTFVAFHHRGKYLLESRPLLNNTQCNHDAKGNFRKPTLICNIRRKKKIPIGNYYHAEPFSVSIISPDTMTPYWTIERRGKIDNQSLDANQTFSPSLADLRTADVPPAASAAGPHGRRAWPAAGVSPAGRVLSLRDTVNELNPPPPADYFQWL